MSGSLERRLARLEAAEEIRQLKARYAEVCDTGYEPERMVPLFTADAVWDGGERFGADRGVDRREDPSEDRLGGAAGELLEHDGAYERPEGSVRVAGPVTDRPDRGDETIEDRVAGADLLDGSGERRSRHRAPGSRTGRGKLVMVR